MNRSSAALVLANLLLAGCGGAEGPQGVLQTDAEGFFVLEAPAEAEEVQAGPEVRSLVALDAEKTTYGGRLGPGGAPSAVFYVRLGDGSMEPIEIRVEPAAASVRDRVLAVLVATPEDRAGADYRAVLHAMTAPAGPEDPPEASPPPVGPRRSLGIVPAGDLRLTDLAPDDLPFVRFRSVEAAYRMLGELDRLAGLLLAAEGHARDHGTLERTLRDLLLPAIWRTNPESERGVSEVGLVLAPALGAGRLRAAVILRVTDPDLHRMQTDAGIAYAAKTDAALPAADHPFGDDRVRRTFRSTVGEFEVVATDPDLLETVATPSTFSIRRLTEHDAVRRELNPDEEGPAPSEACFLFVSRAARERLGATPDRSAVRLAARAERGLRWLAGRWTGVEHPGGAWVVAARPRGDVGALLASVRWADVSTGRSGADVRLQFVDEESAESAAAALRRLSDPSVAWSTACRSNLLDLTPLALADPGCGDLAGRSEEVLGWRPWCPSGGDYTADALARRTRCSVHGTASKPRQGEPPESRIGRVSRLGADVVFQLRIDWDSEAPSRR